MKYEKQREKMIELIVNAKRADPETESFTEFLADFLLAYGVFVPLDDYDLDRLRELVEADRDGRCVVLWAKHGTKVFEIAKTCTAGGYEEKFKFFPDCSDCESCCEKCDASNAVKERLLFSYYELKGKPEGLGKTVFLTREAAEAALKGEHNA